MTDFECHNARIELLMAFYKLHYSNEDVARVFRKYAGVMDDAKYISAIRAELSKAQQQAKEAATGVS